MSKHREKNAGWWEPEYEMIGLWLSEKVLLTVSFKEKVKWGLLPHTIK